MVLAQLIGGSGLRRHRRRPPVALSANDGAYQSAYQPRGYVAVTWHPQLIANDRPGPAAISPLTCAFSRTTPTYWQSAVRGLHHPWSHLAVGRFWPLVGECPASAPRVKGGSRRRFAIFDPGPGALRPGDLGTRGSQNWGPDGDHRPQNRAQNRPDLYPHARRRTLNVAGRQPGGQGVAGSNPVSPTREKPQVRGRFGAIRNGLAYIQYRALTTIVDHHHPSSAAPSASIACADTSGETCA